MSGGASRFHPLKEDPHMIPLLLWILGVPGLIIILLLLIGVIKL